MNYTYTFSESKGGSMSVRATHLSSMRAKSLQSAKILLFAHGPNCIKLGKIISDFGSWKMHLLLFIWSHHPVPTFNISQVMHENYIHCCRVVLGVYYLAAQLAPAHI